ncbi:MAG: hypothetical protein L6R36_002945 [Xanthoria steineri]|nr:MAG: hypothetical protein L6R36_002945 [Xanthoria steineri]
MGSSNAHWDPLLPVGCEKAPSLRLPLALPSGTVQVLLPQPSTTPPLTSHVSHLLPAAAGQEQAIAAARPVTLLQHMRAVRPQPRLGLATSSLPQA